MEKDALLQDQCSDKVAKQAIIICETHKLIELTFVPKNLFMIF